MFLSSYYNFFSSHRVSHMGAFMFHKLTAEYRTMRVVAVCSAPPVLCGWKGFNVCRLCTMCSAEIRKNNLRITSLTVSV